MERIIDLTGQQNNALLNQANAYNVQPLTGSVRIAMEQINEAGLLGYQNRFIGTAPPIHDDPVNKARRKQWEAKHAAWDRDLKELQAERLMAKN